MKKLLTIALFISGFQVTSAQIYFGENIDTAKGWYTEFDLATHFYFVNKSDDSSFTWCRFDVNVPDGFSTAVCDNNLCYPVEVSTANFDLGTNDSFEMILHFYPDNNCGKGSFKLMVFPQADTSNKIVTEVFTEVWCLSAPTVEHNALNLFPNPATNQIDISFGSVDAYDIVIYSMTGEKVLETGSYSLSETVDVSTLHPGLYLVAVSSEGRTFTQTFIKQ